MAMVDLTIPHELDEEIALQRVQQMLEELQNEHKDIIQSGEESWEGPAGAFNFTAKGMKVSGQILVRPSEVALKTHVPFAVSLFSKNIIQIIWNKITQLLTKS